MATTKLDASENRRWVSPRFVLKVLLGSGERLPCLVDRGTWIPVRVATRWAVRYRRYRVQSSTLENNLRVLGRVYDWAEDAGGFDLDDHLTRGETLTARHVESMVLYFRTRGEGGETVVGSDPGVLDQQLSVTENFLKWALDSDNRGGIRTLTLEQLALYRTHLEQVFRSLRTGTRPCKRSQPLGDPKSPRFDEYSCRRNPAAVGYFQRESSTAKPSCETG